MEIKKLRIGNIYLLSNILMAPLAGYTCCPFRMLAYEMGAGLCFTEMVSANALKYEDRATKCLLFTTNVPLASMRFTVHWLRKQVFLNDVLLKKLEISKELKEAIPDA